MKKLFQAIRQNNLEEVKAILEKHPEATMVYSYMQSGQYEKALGENEKWIIKLAEKKKEAQRAHDAATMRECVLELVSALSYKAELLVNLAQNRKESKRAPYYARAMETLKAADEMMPEQAVIKTNMAKTAMLCGEYKKAFAAGMRALELDKEYFPAMEAALCAAYETNHASDVMELSDRIKNLEPDYVQAYEYAALISLEQHQLAQAERELEAAKERGLESFGLRVLALKLAYMRKEEQQIPGRNGRYLKRLDDMIAAVDEKKISHEDKRFLAELYDMKSELVLRDDENEHRMPEVKGPAMKAAALCYSRRYIYHAAFAYRRIRDYKKALELLREYEKKFESGSAIYLHMLECLDFTEQWEQAEPVMKKAQEQAEGDPDIYRRLAGINEHHASRTRDFNSYYDVIKYWKLYLEKVPEKATEILGRIVGIAFILEEWDIAIEHLNLALKEELKPAQERTADTGIETAVRDRSWIYERLVEAYYCKRDYGKALRYTDVLSGECDYYYFRGLIYEKLQDYDNAIRCYREGIETCSDDEELDRFDIADLLRSLYERQKRYKEARTVLDHIQRPVYSENGYVYYQLRLERAMAETNQEKKAVAEALKRAMNQYNQSIFWDELTNMRIYDFGELEDCYGQKQKMLENKLANGSHMKKYYQNLKEITECMALAWEKNDAERLKDLAWYFRHGLEEFYKNDKRRTPFEHYLASDKNGLEHMCHVITYYVCTGQMKEAEALAEKLVGKEACAYCTDSVCTERLGALGIYEQARGRETAYEYYRAAVAHGSKNSFANYKMIRVTDQKGVRV